MMQHDSSLNAGVAAKPTKKVTFSRAAASVKEQKQPTQCKNMRSGEGSADHVQSASVHDNTSSNSGRSKHTRPHRPHSKTNVVAVSLKTRLHCNHLVPKCKCSSTSKKNKTHKTKHVVQGGGIERKVLSSSCALPRGEMNGRKICQSTDESVSICDATWRPIPNTSEDRSKTKSENPNLKFRNRDERVFKKKLRFEDEVTELNERYNHGQIINSVNTNKSQPSSSTQIPSTHYTANSNRDSERDTNEASGDYCRLCEAPDKGYSNGTNRIKKKDQVHNNNGETTTSKFYQEYDVFSSHKESCFLCHKYRNHNCIYDGNYCKICNTHLFCSEGMTESEHSLHQRDSPSAQVAGGENKHTPLTRIPYEPRTKFVRCLKEKLEITYMKDESKQRSKSVETSVALRETEGCKDSHRQLANQAQHIHHGKKCLQHYQQNDRLFLEPIITNRSGQSMCGECGAAQPRNPQREPYLYHITLGGLKTNTDKRHGNASVNRFPNKDKENSKVCNMKPKKVSNDKSKFPYAKLNDSIDNILCRKDIHPAFSRPAPPLNYPVHSYIKRHPSRSMALMDHIM